MSRKPTMNDVAKLAEVGRGTVSNYINGQKVKEENRLKIQKAIDELGYVPNLQAKELRTSINTEVVFIVPTNWTPFFSEMIFYMQKHLGRFGYKMILENSHSSPEEEKDILQMAALNQVAGVITMSYSDLYNFIDFKKKLNLISIERFVAPEVSLISSDNKAGGRLAAKKLIEMKKKNILLIRRDVHHYNATDIRAKAFKEYMRGKKVKVDEFSASLKDTYRQEIVEFLKQKLTSKQYDGIFAVTDEYALVAKEAIGVIQPDLLKEIEIIGFDGARGSKESRIKVDSIQQPIEDIVKEAVSVLIRKIKGEEIGNNYKKILPVSFVKAEKLMGE